MNIHEYQAKAVLREFGVPVPRGIAAFSVAEAVAAAKELGGPVWVVKAQIHAGGRGAGRFKDNPQGKGGVRVVRSIDDVVKNVGEMVGHLLVTKQTGPAGREVKRVYIEEGCEIAGELYLGMLIDRATSRVTVMASTEGGMDIETVAHDHPDKIVEQAIDPVVGFQAYEGRKIAFALGLSGKQVAAFVNLAGGLYKAFTELDCSLIEINPLVVTTAGDVIALDAKMNFDDNGLYRHKDLEALRDVDEEDPAETEAAKYALNYVKLDGQIGCMVNGAGLAMATMDIIKLYGAAPANFLDVGGGATKERVTAAFKIILKDPNVEGILVNIFGGITRCDEVARGLIAAFDEVKPSVPFVVRLDGTNDVAGRELLQEAALPNVHAARTMNEAAEKVVALAAGGQD